GIAEAGLLPALWAALRPGGRLVANGVSLKGERAVLAWQQRNGGELVRIALSRAEPLGGHHAWRPLMPVTQLAATKPGGEPRARRLAPRSAALCPARGFVPLPLSPRNFRDPAARPRRSP